MVGPCGSRLSRGAKFLNDPRRQRAPGVVDLVGETGLLQVYAGASA